MKSFQDLKGMGLDATAIRKAVVALGGAVGNAVSMATPAYVAGYDPSGAGSHLINIFLQDMLSQNGIARVTGVGRKVLYSIGGDAWKIAAMREGPDSVMNKTVDPGTYYIGFDYELDARAGAGLTALYIGHLKEAIPGRGNAARPVWNWIYGVKIPKSVAMKSAGSA